MTEEKTEQALLTANQFQSMMGMLQNETSLIRRDMLAKMFDERRDLNSECGYPDTITREEYRRLYDREGTAKRVVRFWPDECWGMTPEVIETEDPQNVTPFEQAWKDLAKKRLLFHYLHLVDVLSGIGRFGVLLLGVSNSGASLADPIPGVEGEVESQEGESQGAPTGARELLYLRAFDESCLTVDERETDPTSPRYGKPTIYSVTFEDRTTRNVAADAADTKKVHWTRIIHVAEHRESSEVYGTPRMEDVFNRLLDIRKIAGGSGEMFWKGGFPGLSLEINPGLGSDDVELNQDTIRNQMQLYANGMQRYIALAGMSAKSLTPQVANPGPHLEAQLKLIAFTKGVPWRKFMGSEQAQLASEQDGRAWNGRVKRRQDLYLTPMLIRPLIERLIEIRVLPTPAEFFVKWPDLNTVTDQEKVEVAKGQVEAIAKYLAANADELVPPAEFFSIILGWDQEEIDQVMEASEDYQEAMEEELQRKREEGLIPDPMSPPQSDDPAQTTPTPPAPPNAQQDA